MPRPSWGRPYRCSRRGRPHPNCRKRTALPFSLHLGKNVAQLSQPGAAGYAGLDGQGRQTVWLIRWYVTCDAENETFYAENGRLYTRADGLPAEGLLYQD